MTNTRNEGVMQSGGNMTVGNMAVGRNAVVSQSGSEQSAAMQEVQRQLQSLIELLEKHAHEINNHEEVMQSAQSVKEELAKEKPNRLNLKSLLLGIADSVKSVGAIATAVEGLRLAVSALF